MLKWPTLSGKFLDDFTALNLITASRQVGSSDIASTCDTIQQTLSNQVILSQNDALTALRKFAEKQPDVPSFPINETEWANFCTARMAA
jgi:hypothetical protein